MKGKPVIAVCGSVKGEIKKGSDTKAREVGRAVAENNAILLTGACGGLPFEAVSGAKESGGLTVGVSGASDKLRHLEMHHCPTDAFDFVAYTGFGLKGRNVVAVRSADAVIIIGGGVGTLNEVTIALDEGRILGVLLGTGGIADALRSLLKKLKSNREYRVVYSKNPRELVQLVMKEIRR
ncbi:Uncharacterised protein [Candidatus Norongarragalina meridionalis]|nr:Uncharacterised protein [Candidatus Norongarragalina meridionalis]